MNVKMRDFYEQRIIERYKLQVTRKESPSTEEVKKNGHRQCHLISDFSVGYLALALGTCVIVQLVEPAFTPNR